MDNTDLFTLLAVDSDPERLEALNDALADVCRVVTATTVPDALDRLYDLPVQVAVLRRRDPGVEGAALIDALSAHDPDLQIILLDDPEGIVHVSHLPFHDRIFRYLTLPWRTVDLQMTVENAFNYHFSLQEQHRLMSVLRLKNEQLSIQNTNLKTLLGRYETIQAQLLASERFSVIGRLAAQVIHDLRQPLDIVRQSVDTLAHVDLDQAEKDEIAEIVTVELDRFREMIGEILDYTRGKVDLNLRDWSARSVFDVLDRAVRRYLDHHPVRYESRYSGGDGHLRLDIPRLQRTVLNLVKNSVEAMATGGNGAASRIDFTMESSGEGVTLRIADNGPGIPESARERLFDPFVTANKHNGIGLGLAIVKRIVEQHGGTIAFESHGGTTFVISLPATAVPARSGSRSGARASHSAT